MLAEEVRLVPLTELETAVALRALRRYIDTTKSLKGARRRAALEAARKLETTLHVGELPAEPIGVPRHVCERPAKCWGDPDCPVYSSHGPK